MATGVGRVLGEWYLRFATETHTRLWVGFLVLTALSAIVGVLIIDWTSAKTNNQSAARAYGYWLSAAIGSAIFLGLPIFDRFIVQLLWRQVRGALAWHFLQLTGARTSSTPST